MRRIVALILLFTLLLSAPAVQAQGTPSLESVNVLIWPEYDQPAVLVIYHIIVANTTPLPATMTFRIPASAKAPAVVAVGETLESVSDQTVEFSLEPNGEWVDVNIQVTGPAIQLEYYDPSFAKQGQARNYTYIWPGDYSAQTFHVELQRPYDASGMQAAPLLPESLVRNNLTYYTGDFGPLEAGADFQLQFEYQKASDALSISFMSVDQPTLDDNTAGRVSLTTYFPWLIAGVAVLAIAGFLYYYFRGQPRVKPSRRRHRETPAEPSEGGGTRYCPQCGTRARTGDRFCRTCGTRIRQSDEE